MSKQRYTVKEIEELGTRCKFFSMGAERDGWIMPDGVGVDYAGLGQLTFEPETITTADALGLLRARIAVAQRSFEEVQFGYKYTQADGWIVEGDQLVQVCYAMEAQVLCQLHFTRSFVSGSARPTSASIFNLTEALSFDESWTPCFSSWRHGGWYVNNARYPSGAVGCVSNKFVDRRWRVVCDPRRGGLGETGDFTFKSRDEAARAERELVRQEAVALKAKRDGVPATSRHLFPAKKDIAA